jgi:hypothetical protein
MRFTMPAALLLLALATTPAVAGRIFGDIKTDGKPVPAGVLVTVQAIKLDAKGKPEGTPIDSTLTDKVGSYKFMVKDEGKCKLTVVYEKQSPSLEVFSNKEATRYDLILAKKDDKLELRRK